MTLEVGNGGQWFVEGMNSIEWARKGCNIGERFVEALQVGFDALHSAPETLDPRPQSFQDFEAVFSRAWRLLRAPNDELNSAMERWDCCKTSRVRSMACAVCSRARVLRAKVVPIAQAGVLAIRSNEATFQALIVGIGYMCLYRTSSQRARRQRPGGALRISQNTNN